MSSVRKYTASDFPRINEWWERRGMPRIWDALLPDNTTFIVEFANQPVACASLYLMNCKDACMVEMVSSNPDVDKSVRHECIQSLFKHLEKEAGALGYSTLVIFSYEDKIKTRYLELGFTPTLSNVTTFSKRIKE